MEKIFKTNIGNFIFKTQIKEQPARLVSDGFLESDIVRLYINDL